MKYVLTADGRKRMADLKKKYPVKKSYSAEEFEEIVRKVTTDDNLHYYAKSRNTRGVVECIDAMVSPPDNFEWLLNATIEDIVALREGIKRRVVVGAFLRSVFKRVEKKK